MADVEKRNPREKRGPRSMLAALAKAALAAIVTAAAFVAGVEALMASGAIRPSFEQVVPAPLDKGLRVYLDREVLFRVKPRCRPDINSAGYRDREFGGRKGAKKRVIVLGDSFPMGLNVAPEETFPRALERELGSGYEVYNMGVHGYGPDQSLVQLRQDALGYEPDAVVLSVFANDFNDILKNGIFTLTPEGALAKRPKNAVTSVMPSMNSLYLYECLKFRFGPKKMRARSYVKRLLVDLFWDFYDRDLYGGSAAKKAFMGAVLRETARTLGERGVPLLVVAIPPYEYAAKAEAGTEEERQAFALEEALREVCGSGGLVCLDLAPSFREFQDPAALYEGADKHLSVLGNKAVAKHLARYIGMDADGATR